ncbi:MAG: hypothetical protein ABSA10_05745 [Anaerolineales bacterium]|jgi:hypothetical protein
MESTPVSTPPQIKSQKVQVIGVLMLISGIINVLIGLGLVAGLALSLVLICCSPVGLLPMALGIFELIYAIRLLSSGTEPPSFATMQVIAILEIVSILAGNFISLVIGIVNLVMLNDPEVRPSFK